MKKKYYRKNLFTLVELLVVIAIIAILASILLPALGKSKLFAQGAACIANQKQQHLAFLAYTNDFNGMWGGAMISYQTDDNARWYAIAAFYAGLIPEATQASFKSNIQHASTSIGRYKILRCPADQTSYNGTSYLVNYGINAVFSTTKTDFASHDKLGAFDRRYISKIRLPSSVMWAGDSLPNEFGDNAYRFAPSVSSSVMASSATDKRVKITERHNKKAYYLMADGHVASMSLSQLNKEAKNYTDPFFDSDRKN